MFRKKKPELFMGLTEEELYERQMALMDISETVGLTDEEHSAIVTAVNAILAIQDALACGGKIDWKAWGARGRV